MNCVNSGVCCGRLAAGYPETTLRFGACEVVHTREERIALAISTEGAASSQKILGSAPAPEEKEVKEGSQTGKKQVYPKIMANLKVAFGNRRRG